MHAIQRTSFYYRPITIRFYVKTLNKRWSHSMEFVSSYKTQSFRQFPHCCMKSECKKRYTQQSYYTYGQLWMAVFQGFWLQREKIRDNIHWWCKTTLAWLADIRFWLSFNQLGGYLPTRKYLTRFWLTCKQRLGNNFSKQTVNWLYSSTTVCHSFCQRYDIIWFHEP